jgi:predicted Zn-dependent protease
LLATCLNEQGQHAEALRVCADATVRFPASYILKFLQARTLVLAGDFTAARGILDTLTILPFEGSRIGRDLYRQANLLEAASRMRDGKSADALALLKRARLWPERLGAGKPYHADARLEDLLEARILRAQGDSSAAHRLLTGILDSTSMLPTTAHTLVSALAYRDLGRAHDGQALLTAWTSREPDNGMATWSDLTFHKVKTGAIEDRLRSSLLHPSSGDPDFLLLVWTSKILDL